MKNAVIVALGVTFLTFLFLGIQLIYPCKGGGTGCTGMMGHGGGMGGHEGDTMGGGHDVSSHSGHEYGGEPLTREQAIDLMEEHLKTKAKEIPDLTLGDVSENKDYFEAEITDQEGAVVDKVRVSKSSKMLESQKVDHPISPEGHVH